MHHNIYGIYFADAPAIIFEIIDRMQYFEFANPRVFHEPTSYYY